MHCCSVSAGRMPEWMPAVAQVAAVEAASAKSSTKALELEGALSELQSAMAQLAKSTGVKPPTVRATGGGGGQALAPSGAYAPLPAMFPPFAFSGAAAPNKVGPGGPHKETFTVVRD